MAARDDVKRVPEITRNHCPNSAKCANKPETAFVPLQIAMISQGFDSTSEQAHGDRDNEICGEIAVTIGPDVVVHVPAHADVARAAELIGLIRGVS